MVTPGTPPANPANVNFSVPNTTGLVLMSSPAAGAALNNMATSLGFPFTTGQISLSQPAALGGKENFKITGMDGRVNGVGTIQLVASALSKRAVTGPNSNRSWAQYTLPEPGAVLGAAAALLVLGVCHALARRRSDASLLRPFRDGSARAGPSRIHFPRPLPQAVSGWSRYALLALACAGGPLPRVDPVLAEVWSDYSELPDARALAVAGELHQDRWVMGSSGGHATEEAAAESAMRECRKHRAEQRTPAACRLYAVGDEIVWSGPR